MTKKKNLKQKFCNSVTAIHREKFIILNAYVKKEDKLYKVNISAFTLNQKNCKLDSRLVKEKQKISTRKY